MTAVTPPRASRVTESKRQSPGLVVFMEKVGESWLRKTNTVFHVGVRPSVQLQNESLSVE